MHTSYVLYIFLSKQFANMLAAYSDQDSRIWLCADSAHERTPMGVLLYLLCLRCLQLR
jgi:hypothetical protein